MRTLIVFDFDYTLAKTIENIWVWSPRGTRSYNNKLYNPIHPIEIQKTKIADDEIINNESFLEFHDINLDKLKIIKRFKAVAAFIKCLTSSASKLTY